MFTAALFIVTKFWKQPKSFSRWMTNCDIATRRNTTQQWKGCKNQGESSMHFARKMKETRLKGYLLDDIPIYMPFWKKQNDRVGNQMGCLGLGRGKGLTTEGHEETFGGWWKYSISPLRWWWLHKAYETTPKKEPILLYVNYVSIKKIKTYRLIQIPQGMEANTTL